MDKKFQLKIFPYLAIFLIPILYFDNRVSTEYFWSKAFWLNLLAYGGILYWLTSSLKTGKWDFYHGRTTIPVTLFSILAVLSLLWSYNYFKGAELILKVGGSIGIYFLIINSFKERKDIVTFIEIAFIATFIVIFYGLLQYSEILYLPKDQYGESDPSSTIGLTNFVLHYVIVLLPSYIGLLGVTKSNLKRVLILSGMIPLYYYFFIAQNRASLIGAIVEILFGIFLILLYVKVKKVNLPFSTTTIIWIIFFFTAGAYLILFQTESGRKIRKKFSTVVHFETVKDDSIRFRLETWSRAPEIIKDHPFGLGLANLEIYFPLYYTPYLINMTLNNNTRVVRSHNDYVQTLVDLGIEGFIILLWIIAAIISIFWTLVRKINNWDDFWLFWSISTGIVGFFTVMFFSFPLQEPTASLYFWSFVGLLEVLYLQYREKVRVISIKSMPINTALTIFATFVFLLTVILSFRGWKAEVFYKEARLLKSIQKWELSKILLDDAIKNNPTMEGFYYDRAVSLIKMGHMDAALRDLEQTAKMVPYYGIGRQQLGYFYYQMGNCDKALPHLLTAYRIYYTAPLKYATYILSCYIKKGEYKKALDFGEDAYKKAKKKLENIQKRRKPSKNILKKYAEFLEALGDVYTLTGKYSLAAKMFQEALEYHKNSDTMVNLGLTLIRLEEYSKAITVLTDAITTNPGSAKAWYNLGEAYYRIGDKEKALNALKKSFLLDPTLKLKAERSKLFRDFPELQKILKK